MKNCKSIIAAIVAVLLLLPCLFACSDEPIGSEQTTASSAVTTAAPESNTEALTEQYELKDSIPDDINFNNQEVTILYWKSVENEWVSEGITGDNILDAIFARNSKVEERLGVELKYHEIPGNASKTDSYCLEIQKSIESGDPTYSLISAYSRNAIAAAVKGYLQNLADYKQIELDRPWYCHSAVEAATVGKKTYCVAGAISHSYLSRMAGCFFNSDILNASKLEDPYDLVLSNKWTLDKFLEMQTGLWIDLDGNGIKSAADQFGVHTDNPQIDTLQYSSGLVYCDYDENHIPKISADVSGDKISKVIDKWLLILENGYISSTDDTACFTTGRAAFYIYPLAHVCSEGMRNATFTFGFVPQPKYDAEQENYIVSLTNYFSFWGIPTAVPNNDMSAYLIECLSSEGYRTIVPAVFETAYKYKYTSDATNRQATIFDEMRENVHVDFGKICTLSMGNVPATLFYSVVSSGTNNYLVRYKANKKTVENGLADAIKGLS